MERIRRVEAQADFRLRLWFTDGVEGEVDLSDLVGKGVFRAWEDPEELRKVTVNDVGAPEWPGGIDMCPDSLYLQMLGL